MSERIAHQTEPLPDGGTRCTLCLTRFSSDAWGDCPGVPQFRWDAWPEGMFTAKQMKQKRLLLGPVRGAIWYPKAADGRGFLWLYREDEGMPNPLTETQKRAIEKGKATKRARRTCGMCGEFQEERMEAAFVLESGFCRCCQVRHFTRELLKEPFVVLDLETTGLDDDSEIIQVGIVSSTGEVLLNTYVKPTVPIDERRYWNVDDYDDEWGPRLTAFGVNGISNAMVAAAPSFPQVYPSLCALLLGRTVVCYNAYFDRRMLRENCKRHELPEIEATWKCAQVAFAQFYGEYSSRYGDYKFKSLDFACDAMKVGFYPAHDGVADALATLHLFRALAEPPKKRETIEEASAV